MVTVAVMLGVFDGGPSHVGNLEDRLGHLYASHALILGYRSRDRVSVFAGNWVRKYKQNIHITTRFRAILSKYFSVR